MAQYDLNEARNFLNLLYPDFVKDRFILTTNIISKAVSGTICHNSIKSVMANTFTVSGKNVYFQLGLLSKRTNGNERGKVVDVTGIPGFWMDIDIKNDAGHKKKELPESIDVAMSFLSELPSKPSIIVNSGGGLHVYWLFNHVWLFIDEEERKIAKAKSKAFQRSIIQAGKAKGWELDNTKSLNQLLRIPGTINYKYDPPQKVCIVQSDTIRYEPNELVQLNQIDNNAIRHQYSSTQMRGKAISTCPIDCAFLKHCIDDASTLPEPEWFAMISVLCRCPGGNELIHEYSKPYPKYDPNETDNKISHCAYNTRPRTCRSIKNDLGFTGCANCSYYNKIESPISLLTKKYNIDIIYDSLNITPNSSFPFHVLPDDLNESIQQLARSCATSSNSLPGIIFSIFGALCGRNISAHIKRNWRIDLIFWHGDIRRSGEGKSPASNCLINTVIDELSSCDISNLKSNEIFVNDYTIEGLAKKLNEHPTGGILCDTSELSTFFNSQNQYKKKGTDREALLRLWDGNSINNVRKSSEIYIEDPRVSFIGGIQPETFKSLFEGQGKIYTEDGSIYRFLFTYDNTMNTIEHTLEEWSEHNEYIFRKYVQFVLSITSTKNRLEIDMFDGSKEIFIDWANELKLLAANSNSSQIAYFLHKADIYTARIAAMLSILKSISQNNQADITIDLQTMKDAILVMKYYLENEIRVGTELLQNKNQCQHSDINNNSTNTEQEREQLITLIRLAKDKFDNGLITIGELHEISKTNDFTNDLASSSRGLGEIIKKFDLSKTTTTNRANSIQGLCLIWDNKLEELIKN